MIVRPAASAILALHLWFASTESASPTLAVGMPIVALLIIAAVGNALQELLRERIVMRLLHANLGLCAMTWAIAITEMR